MPRLRTMALPLLLIVALSGGCGGASMPTCGDLADVLVSGHLVIEEIGSDETTCEVSLSGPSDEVLATGSPAAAMHDRFEAEGWVEFLSRSADGPGTTAFVFTRGADSCEVSAGAPSYLDGGEIVTAPEYRLILRCVRMADSE